MKICYSVLKKTIALTFILFTSINLSFSQQPSITWAKQAGGNEGDNCTDVLVAADGNIYSAGNYTGVATFGSIVLQATVNTSRGYISKSNANGTVLWAKDMGSFAYRVVPGPQGSIYVFGYFIGTENFGGISITSSNSNYADMFLLKMNANGDVLWAKNFAGIFGNSNSIVSDASGNIYIGGSFAESATFGSTTLTQPGQTFDVFLAKIDPNGIPLWAQKYGGANNDFFTALDIDANGNPFITGYFSTGTTIGTSSFVCFGFYDIFVFKTDSNGGVIWAKQFGGGDDDRSSAIAVDSQGNAYLTGTCRGTYQFGSFSASSTNYSAYLCKINSSGTPLWLKYYLTNQNHQSLSLDVTIDHLGNIYSTGSSNAPYTFNAQHSVNVTAFSGAYVLKSDANGNVLWAKGFGGIVNQAENHGYGYSIDADLAGNVYVGGTFSGTIDSNPLLQTNINNFNYDIFLMKIGVSTVGIDEMAQSLFTLYPNPANDQFTLFNTSEGNSFQLVDNAGKIVFQGKTTSESTIIHTENLVNGMYFIHFIENGSIFTGKILVNH